MALILATILSIVVSVLIANAFDQLVRSPQRPSSDRGGSEKQD
jgi:hypothetical protein